MVIIHPTHSFSQAKPHSDEQLEIPFVFDSNSPTHSTPDIERDLAERQEATTDPTQSTDDSEEIRK